MMDVAGTNVNQALYIEDHNPCCPSCDHTLETCAHVLQCNKIGRIEALHCTMDWLDNWLKEAERESPIYKRDWLSMHMDVMIRQLRALH